MSAGVQGLRSSPQQQGSSSSSTNDWSKELTRKFARLNNKHRKELQKRTVVTMDPRIHWNSFLPFEENQVVLSTGKAVNASTVDVTDDSSKYIAASWPMRTCQKDFWQMIAEKDTSVVVTLSEPNNSLNCDCYWPKDGETLKFDELQVEKIGTDEIIYDTNGTLLEIKRKFLLKFGGQEKTVVQLHFPNWADESMLAPEILFQLISLVEEDAQKNSGELLGSEQRIVVHCRAGVGRTGAYIAARTITKIFWKCLLNMIDDFNPNVKKIVQNIRHQRMWLVHSKKQYIGLYDYVKYLKKVLAKCLSNQLLREDLTRIVKRYHSQTNAI